MRTSHQILWSSAATRYKRRATSLGDSVIMAYLRAHVYQLVEVDDPGKHDAVSVRIGEEPFLPPFLPPSCFVSWPEKIHQVDKIRAESEGPYPVLTALNRAHDIAALYGFARVVVSMQHPERWDPMWGKLV